MSTVYLQRFKLDRQPFALLPDAAFFFEGERRGSLLCGLQHAVLDDAGLCVVVGEVGTGKTMLCRMLAQALARHEADVAFVPDASLPRQALLTSIAADLGLHSSGPGGAVLALQQALTARAAHGRRLVLLIDEAHTLQPDALDAVRMLMNVETGQRKLLQIILFGQPELQALLRRPDLRQVHDRIAHQFYLAPLSQDGARAYLEHRLRLAGWRGDTLLEPAAMQALVKHAAGRFRALSQLADKALLAAYSEGAASVAKPHVKRAWRDMQGARGQVAWKPSAAWAAGLLPAAALAVLLGMQLGGHLSDLLGPPRAPVSIRMTSAIPSGPEALLQSAPPAAAPLAAPSYFTMQLASLASQDEAEIERERLNLLGVSQSLFVLARPSKDPKRRHEPPMWVVCAGRYDSADSASRSLADVPQRHGLNRPRVLKVDS